MKEIDLKGALDKNARQGRLASKDALKAQNVIRSQSDQQKAFYDQNMVKTGVRRFVEPSEGDSIFNFDNDVAKKTKKRIKLGPVATQNFISTKETSEVDRHNSKMNQQLNKYRKNPELVELDAKMDNIKRM